MTFDKEKFERAREAWQKAMKPHYDGLGAAMDQINAIAGVDALMTCSACPVQLEGTIDGIDFYFRARYEYWEFTIDPDDPVMAHENALFFRTEETDGDGFSAGWMNGPTLLEVFQRCHAQWKEQHGTE